MRLPARISSQHSLRRWVAACAIGLVCAAVGMVLWAPFAVLGAVRTLDFVFYDSLYRLRPTRDMRDGPLVIVAVDDASLEAIKRSQKVGWPWPRRNWGQIVSYLQSAGAKAVVFDLIFDTPSAYNGPAGDAD